MENQQRQLTEDQIKIEQANFIAKVYGWMCAALVVTGLTAWYVAQTEELILALLSNKFLFYGLLIGEVLLVGYISKALPTMDVMMAKALFFLYAMANGLTLSLIFVIFTASSIASSFFITAGTFAVMSLYGYFTKSDLTSMGRILMMGLIGLIIASIVNIFMQSTMMHWIISYVGVFIFTGLIAYDTQKIKEMNIIGNEGTDEDTKESLMGALTLYLDFINLFLYILRIFGDRK
ncbi:Bax inhibitor-1/YccA family protein [Flavobacterium sp.]|jgi:FtsH-binding integral membrane protein|uniref:Bax inhibitor-1/YccA family protein n=1 Tax=Flavobacterium sp. TaxID=239 RepID=UPI0025BBC142|nr:Bax inhibitor-1/YccA family protein [Flavobacterium sp.]